MMPCFLRDGVPKARQAAGLCCSARLCCSAHKRSEMPRGLEGFWSPKNAEPPQTNGAASSLCSFFQRTAPEHASGGAQEVCAHSPGDAWQCCCAPVCPRARGLSKQSQRFRLLLLARFPRRAILCPFVVTRGIACAFQTGSEGKNCCHINGSSCRCCCTAAWSRLRRATGNAMPVTMASQHWNQATSSHRWRLASQVARTCQRIPNVKTPWFC